MAELNLFSPSRDWLSHDYDSDCPVTTLIEVEEDPVSYVGEDLAGFVEHDPYYSEFGILDHVDLCASPQSVGERLDLDSRVEAQAKHRILGRALPSHSPDYSTGSQNERGKENCGGHNHAVVTSPSKTGLLKQIPAKAGGRFQRSGGEACAGGGIGLARRRRRTPAGTPTTTTTPGSGRPRPPGALAARRIARAPWSATAASSSPTASRPRSSRSWRRPVPRVSR